MKLIDIHTKYATDKGTDHNYIIVYDDIFQEYQNKECNVLEIGTLMGGSLKMWDEYFTKGKIYGIEDFSQLFGFGGVKIQKEKIIQELSEYQKIKLLVFDSTNKEKISENLKNLSFDIIIDDASHTIDNQISNLINYFPYLNKNGTYVIEDVAFLQYGEMLIQTCKKNFNVDGKIINLNVFTRHDDRLVIFKK